VFGEKDKRDIDAAREEKFCMHARCQNCYFETTKERHQKLKKNLIRAASVLSRSRVHHITRLPAYLKSKKKKDNQSKLNALFFTLSSRESTNTRHDHTRRKQRVNHASDRIIVIVLARESSTVFSATASVVFVIQRATCSTSSPSSSRGGDDKSGREHGRVTEGEQRRESPRGWCDWVHW
jgi:hypothetical protein